MKWTKEPPTEPGWYWFKNRAGKTGIVEVLGTFLDKAQEHYAFFTNGEVDYCLDWAGPIEEPSE